MFGITAFGLSVIVSGTIFIWLMLWLWMKRDLTLQKKSQITLFLLAGLAGVIYASFAFALISPDNASYYSEGRNPGNIDYAQIVSNARQAGYIVRGPNYLDSDINEATGLWSPRVSQVRAYLGNDFWVSSVNYYFSKDISMEARFENGSTVIIFFNESRQSPSSTPFETEHLPDDEMVIDALKAIFGVSDTTARTYLDQLKDNIEEEGSTDATIIIAQPPDFNSIYADMKNRSDRFNFTETTGNGSIRQVFHEDGKVTGSINYIVQNSKIIHRESGNAYVLQVDPRGGINIQVRLAVGAEIPEADYRSTLMKMFSDVGLDPNEVENFEFEYTPSSGSQAAGQFYGSNYRQ
jgi:hypothetical protein